MATALSDALPLLNVDGTGRNNARSFRKGLLASLLLPQSGAPNPLACRPGVLVHDYDANGVKSLRVDQTATASGSVVVNPGAFGCERANQGTYVGWLETSAGVTITPPTSDASNPRYDVVYVQVQDKSAISTDATSGGIVDVVTGTPSATPTVPAVTVDGAVPIAQLYRPAGVPGQTITTANITDVRKSTGLVGTVRRLLPGDFLSDAGKVDGELRYRQAVAGLPSLVDYWDAGQSRWRGTQSFTLTATFPGTPDAGGNVQGNVSSGGTIVSVSIPDPGYPYRVQTGAYLTGISTLTGTGNSGSCNVYINVNNGPFSSCLLTSSDQPVSTVTNRRTFSLFPLGAAVFTGASTVRLKSDQFNNADNFFWLTDQRNPLTCRVDPA